MYQSANCYKLNTRNCPNVIMAFAWCRRQHRTYYGRRNNIMCPWKLDAIQKSSLSKPFVESKISTVSDRIFLFVQKLYLDDPYNKMCTVSSSQWFNKVISIMLRLSRNCLFYSENKVKRKRWWLVVSISALQRQNGLTVSRKLWKKIIFSQGTKVKSHPG